MAGTPDSSKKPEKSICGYLSRQFLTCCEKPIPSAVPFRRICPAECRKPLGYKGVSGGRVTISYRKSILLKSIRAQGVAQGFAQGIGVHKAWHKGGHKDLHKGVAQWIGNTL